MDKINYPHIVAPLKIGNVVLRNRIIASASTPGNLQGPQNYPTESIIQHYAHKAETAALVTVNGWGNTPFPNDHSLIFDFNNGGVQQQLTRLTESVHYYGSLATSFLFPTWDQDHDVGEGIASEEPYYQPGRPMFTKEYIMKMIEDYADMAARTQELGFDGAYIHAAYRGLPVARFLSPLCNNRPDEFGGSVENRARFLIMLCDRIKQKCGKDYLLEVSISGEDKMPGGATLADTAEVAKLGVGHFDIIQPRSHGLDPNHPSGYIKARHPYKFMCEYLKQAGVTMPIAGVSGYLYPEETEEQLRDGAIDLVAMGRAWVCNPDYGKLLYEGKRDDLVPCIRCNKCYTRGGKVTWRDTCSVNPMWTWETRQQYFIKPAGEKKKIAVVGGGPAGMEAAIVAAQRGHDVTLFEKSGQLGGQLNLAEIPSFKWPIRDFKKYLIKQVAKNGVNVLMNTEATADILDAGGYDEVIAAVGAEPNILKVPGWDKPNVVAAMDIYGHEAELPESVIIIGGGEIGAETGMHLGELGHKVQLIEMTDTIAADAPPFHFRSMMFDYADKIDNFKYTVNARCKQITDEGVIYTDKDGVDHELKAGKVIMATGSNGRQDAALALYSAGRKVTMIGDCRKALDLHNAMRTGFAAASQL